MEICLVQAYAQPQSIRTEQITRNLSSLNKDIVNGAILGIIPD